LLHVIDSSQENYELQMQAVLTVLKELESESKPTFNVFNKIDKLENPSALDAILVDEMSLGISAKNNLQLDALLHKIEDHFSSRNQAMMLLIPFADGDKITLLHEIATIQSTEYTEHGTVLQVTVPREAAAKFEKYKIGENN